MAITDNRDRELAKVLIHHSIRARKGELVFINAVGRDTDGLVEAIVEELLGSGAAPYVQHVEPEINRKLLHGISTAPLEKLAEYELALIEKTDCYIGIRGSDNIFELSDVPPRKMELYNRILGHPVRDKRVRDTRWVVLRYPNSAMAQLAQQPREPFADFYYRVCTLDYSAMTRAIKPLKSLMEKTDRVHVKGPGTDLRMSIRKIPVLPCTGTHNIPDGECFTAPVRKSVEGTVSFNAPTIWEGVGYENVVLTFEKGRVVDAVAANPEQTRRLNRVLDQDEGARYVGEFSLGFNPYILHPMRDILFDEKIAGSFHMALGMAYPDADNGNRSGLHWDMVCIQRADYGGGEIHFDGKLIRKDGVFTVPALKALNPEAFGIQRKKAPAKTSGRKR